MKSRRAGPTARLHNRSVCRCEVALPRGEHVVNILLCQTHVTHSVSIHFAGATGIFAVRPMLWQPRIVDEEPVDVCIAHCSRAQEVVFDEPISKAFISVVEHVLSARQPATVAWLRAGAVQEAALRELWRLNLVVVQLRTASWRPVGVAGRDVGARIRAVGCGAARTKQMRMSVSISPAISNADFDLKAALLTRSTPGTEII